ncbi:MULTISPECIES: toxin-antitoxin system YwqK family antitoxin [unclassified Saccharicrinis]|uniref:toxin-antitoxin system YwqK family antitoxin n=1 Tax=unclassified Saccharicrinis TaxID=2646859 RepID=UPI003D345130
MKKIMPFLILFLLVALFVVVEYGDEMGLKINFNLAEQRKEVIEKAKPIKKGAFVKNIHYGSDPSRPVKWKVNMKYNHEGKGIRHGESIRYWESGEMASRMNYVEDKKHGTYLAYFKNGKVWKELTYENGAISGQCKHYDRQGRLTAEYRYKNGLPGTGLKEYTNLGKQRKQPKIHIERIDEVRSANKYTLKLSLAGENAKRYRAVTFYMGDLVEGKYFSKNISEVESLTSKTARIVLEIPKGYVVNKTINIVAVAKNSEAVKLILQKKVEVAVRGV